MPTIDSDGYVFLSGLRPVVLRNGTWTSPVAKEDVRRQNKRNTMVKVVPEFSKLAVVALSPAYAREDCSHQARPSLDIGPEQH